MNDRTREDAEYWRDVRATIRSKNLGSSSRRTRAGVLVEDAQNADAWLCGTPFAPIQSFSGDFDTALENEQESRTMRFQQGH